MVTVKIAGMGDIILHEREFNELVQSLKSMIVWGVGGIYGDGEKITNKAGIMRAKKTLEKLGYK